tara:strand:+ start:1178 stop:1717 length:540 start_codon:yes stop_codon:yes gene_type:complete
MKIDQIKKSYLLPYLFITLQLVSCNKDEVPQNTTSVQWNMSIDGQNYSYEASYTESGDLSDCPAIFQTNGGIPEGGGQIILIGDDGASIQIASVDLTTTGSYVFDSESEGVMSIMHGMNAYTSEEGSVTVNVTTFPLLVWGATSDLESTIATGDFSGTVMDVFDTPHTISGSFDAIRVQ